MAEDRVSLNGASSTPVADARPADGAPKQTLRTVLAVLVLAAAFALVPRMTRGCDGLSTNEIAPDFQARVVANSENIGALAAPDGGAEETGAPKHLELSRLRGRTVVLDFWATWCGPCQAEAPILNTIAQRYKDRGLAVIGVNTSDEDGLAAAYVKRRGIGFPIVYDEGNAIAKKYNVSNLPTLVVVSKTGKIVAIRHGVTSDAALDDIVRRYL